MEFLKKYWWIVLIIVVLIIGMLFALKKKKSTDKEYQAMSDTISGAAGAKQTAAAGAAVWLPFLQSKGYSQGDNITLYYSLMAAQQHNTNEVYVMTWDQFMTAYVNNLGYSAGSALDEIEQRILPKV